MSIIKSLEITNFQRISAVKIEPTNNVIMLFGENANGKSSVLDAIETTFCKFNARVTKRPVKDGAGRADIKIQLTDGTELHQKFIPSGPALSGTGPDGSKIGQKDIDQVISVLGVDAAAFINAGERKQLETLLSVVELPFVPDELDARRAEVFAERTGVNRDVKQLEAQHAAFLPMPDDLPDEEVSVSTLLTQHHTAAQQNAAVREAFAMAHTLERRVADLAAQLTAAQEELAKAVAHAQDAPALIDTDAIQAQIDTAEVTNSQIRVSKEKRAVGARLLAAVQTAGDLTAQLEQIDQTKADALAAASNDMPIEGLTFDEEGVLYQGIPFSRASGAEQIIVSAAMIIATNPEIRTMVIRNGNVMDANSLQVLQDMCEDNNFQAFVEFVSDSTDHEFRLVDGELAA